MFCYSTYIAWEYTTEQIILERKKGLLDCGIISTPLGDSSLNEMPLFYENFVAYISKSSSLVNKKTITATDIDLDELWLLNEGHCMHNQILNICQLKKTNRKANHFEYNTDSVETLKRMVDLNNGITILPELSLAEFSVK